MQRERNSADVTYVKHIQRGFSLIELMIVVAVIGVLAAIAYPNYQEYMAKTRRADAQSALSELAQFMERRYTTNGRYGAADCSDVVLPFTQAPRDGGAAFYNIGIVCDATTFKLTAVPTGVMTGDRCGNLTLTQTGARDIEDEDDDTTIEQCWRR